MNKSHSSLSSESSVNDNIQISTERKNLKFLQKFQKQEINFQRTWLNKVTQEAKQKIDIKMKNQLGKGAEKFKYLFSVPLVVNDPKLVKRKHTYEVFSKNQQLEMYYYQLKKAKGIAKTINQKADYKEVVSQINNDKVQDKNFEKFRKDRGLIYTNELWSQKLINQIYDQSRLKELSELLQLKKIKMSYEDQVIQFEKFFNQVQKTGKHINSTDLVKELNNAFKIQQYVEENNSFKNKTNENNNLSINTHSNEPKTLYSFLNKKLNKKESQDQNNTQEFSTKNSRLASRNQSQQHRPNTSDFSVFSRRGSTSQLFQRSQKPSLFSYNNSPVSKLQQVLKQTAVQMDDTKQTVKEVKGFFLKEQLIQEQQVEQKQRGFKIKSMKNAIKLKKDKEQNSHIVGRLNN